MSVKTFKVGDKVVLNQSYDNLHRGMKGLVLGVLGGTTVLGPLLSIQFRRADGNSYIRLVYSSRFDLASDDLSALSDQDLADNFRKLRDESVTYFGELNKRGFQMRLAGGSSLTLTKPSHPVTITKTKTETVTL